MSDRAYKMVPTCPFCRRGNYETRSLLNTEANTAEPNAEAHASEVLASLDGTWAVSITESSSVGTTKHKITMIIEGASAKYIAADDDESHYHNGEWVDLAFGHTSSGESFVAKQSMSCAPSWLGQCSIQGCAGLRGKLSGRNSATFATSMTVLAGRNDDEIEFEQVGKMTRVVG